MTPGWMINQLIVLRQQVTDDRQQAALREAIEMMRSCADWYTRAYMRGYHDAAKKGKEA